MPDWICCILPAQPESKIYAKTAKDSSDVTAMTISVQLLLICSAFGGLNGLLLAGYFFCQRTAVLTHRLAGLLVLMLSVRILKSVLFYFNPEIGKHILQLGLSACWMIGPVLYAYCLSVCQPEAAQRWYRWLLALPLVLVLLAGMLWPYAEYPALWGGLLYRLINYSWLGFILLSGLVLWRHWQQSRITTLQYGVKHGTLLLLWFSNLLLWCAFYFASYTSYISGALTFSLLLACSVLTVIYHQQQPAKAYANKKLDASTAEPLLTQLQQWMQTQQPYLDASLTMPKLARQLGWPSNRLSQLLNDNLAQSFPDYINSFRIRHAQTLLCQQPVPKMPELAERCGFHSLSTFYSAFKKHTGMTPALYRQQQPTTVAGTASEMINPESGIMS